MTALRKSAIITSARWRCRARDSSYFVNSYGRQFSTLHTLYIPLRRYPGRRGYLFFLFLLTVTRVRARMANQTSVRLYSWSFVRLDRRGSVTVSVRWSAVIGRRSVADSATDGSNPAAVWPRAAAAIDSPTTTVLQVRTTPCNGLSSELFSYFPTETTAFGVAM